MLLSNAEKKLLIKMLEMASDEFANHGCNDFELIDDGGLTEEEAKEIITRIDEDNGDDMGSPNFNNYYTQDWIVMDYLRRLIESNM